MSHANTTASEALFASNYLSLSTRRKNGTWVDTPVWFAGDPVAFYVFSADEAGKVKRLRNFREARVAQCTATGKLQGSWLPAQATLIDDAPACEQAYTALRAKYGWQLRLTDLLSRLGGRYQQRQLIRLRLTDGGNDG